MTNKKGTYHFIGIDGLADHVIPDGDQNDLSPQKSKQFLNKNHFCETIV